MKVLKKLETFLCDITMCILGILFAASVMLIIGCTSSENSGLKSDSLKSYATKEDAAQNSPIGLTCEITTQVPISRGRGQGLEGKYETRTEYFPAFLRGDVNADGQINRDDANIAVKKLFDPEKFPCPAAADIGGYPQTTTPDGFFTSQDTILWNEFKHTGIISWPPNEICAFDCPIQNHMKP